MNQQKVIVTVSPNGEVIVEADGVVGSGCEALTRPMEEALGGVSGDKRKPEYHKQAQQQQGQSASQ